MSETRQQSDDRHASFRERIALHVAGLLAEDEERAFAAHAEECHACHEVLSAYRREDESGGSEGGHIPAGVLAAWPRASRELVGRERELVRTHLATCEACRAELEALGYPPELNATVLSPASRDGASTHRVESSAPSRQSGGGGRIAVWSGWLAAASLAVALILRSGLEPAHGPTRPVPAPVQRPVTPSPGSGLASEPVRLESPRRGLRSTVRKFGIGLDTRFVVLGIPPLEIPDSARVEITCAGSEGHPIASLQVRNSDLFGRRGIAFASDAGVWRPGRYSLVVSGRPGPGAILTTPETARYEFELVSESGLVH